MEVTKEEVELKCLSVLCGDALLVHFLGKDGVKHNILVDGGFVKTYKHILKPELEKIFLRGENIALVIATHYDSDHIGGLIQFVNDKSFDLQGFVERWWLNCDLPLIDPDGAISVDQLLTLKTMLQSQHKYPEKPIVVGAQPLDLYGAQLTILSPDDLRYNQAKSLIEKKTTEIAAAANDFGYPIAYFKEKVHKETEEDRSPSNGSSITVLFSLMDNNILLMGDAFPSVVSKSLKDLGHDASRKPLWLECLKLSHHASKGNISNELLSLVRTTKFIVSANAINPHNLPNKETIVRILVNGKRGRDDYFDFYFTHKNPTMEAMFAVDGSEVYEKCRFRMHFPDSGENGIYIKY